MSKRNLKVSKRPAAYGAECKQDNNIIRTTIHGVGNIASSAGGLINTVITMNPNTLASSEFATDFASAYDQFRVLGCRLRLVSQQTNSTTVANNMLVVLFDNDDSTAITSYTNGLQFSTSIASACIFQHCDGDVFQRTWWRPTRGEDTPIDWVDCNTPANSLGSIKLYGDTLTATTNYFTYEVELFCEFRGRR
jgi:hypothetical protein